MLTDDTLRDLLDAAISARLHRDVLLLGVPPHVVAHIPPAGSLADRIREDLRALRDAGVQPDGSLPLRAWLNNASMVVGPRVEADVFRRALLELDAAAGRS